MKNLDGLGGSSLGTYLKPTLFSHLPPWVCNSILRHSSSNAGQRDGVSRGRKTRMTDLRKRTTVTSNMPDPVRVLYCHCAYAQVVPKEVKEAVLRQLSDSNLAFDAVADLCELSARRSEVLKRLASGGSVKIAACYPRAVKWLFAAANAPLDPASCEVLNMRVENATAIAERLFAPDLQPNLPAGKETVSNAPSPTVESASV